MRRWCLRLGETISCFGSQGLLGWSRYGDYEVSALGTRVSAKWRGRKQHTYFVSELITKFFNDLQAGCFSSEVRHSGQKLMIDQVLLVLISLVWKSQVSRYHDELDQRETVEYVLFHLRSTVKLIRTGAVRERTSQDSISADKQQRCHIHGLS